MLAEFVTLATGKFVSFVVLFYNAFSFFVFKGMGIH